MAEKTPPPANLRPFLLELERYVDDLKHGLPCCPNCDHWSKKHEHCTYGSQNVRPPAEVIAFGCWAYEREVPF